MISRYATCRECSRTFDLCNENDADEWAYGHDCEDTDGLAYCDGCHKGFSHELREWKGADGQGLYCAKCYAQETEQTRRTFSHD